MAKDAAAEQAGRRPRWNACRLAREHRWSRNKLVWMVNPSSQIRWRHPEMRPRERSFPGLIVRSHHRLKASTLPPFRDLTATRAWLGHSTQQTNREEDQGRRRTSFGWGPARLFCQCRRYRQLQKKSKIAAPAAIRQYIPTGPRAGRFHRISPSGIVAESVIPRRISSYSYSQSGSS